MIFYKIFRHNRLNMNDKNEYKKSYSLNLPENGKFMPTDPLPRLDIKKLYSFFIIPDDCEGQKIIFNHFGFGRKQGNIFILSPYEVLFLSQLQKDPNMISIENKNDINELWQYCCSLFGPSIFPIQYAIYHYFRCRYWVVRDGSIYGFLFVLYSDHPDVVHSKYTVQMIEDWNEVLLIAPSITRINWGVRKKALLVRVIVPSESDLKNPDCISTFVIESMCLQRLEKHY